MDAKHVLSSAARSASLSGSSSSTGSLLIRAPPTLDDEGGGGGSDFEPKAPRIDVRYGTSSCSDECSERGGSDCERLFASGDDFETALERPFVADPDEEKLEGVGGIAKDRIFRPFVACPDANKFENSFGEETCSDVDEYSSVAETVAEYDYDPIVDQVMPIARLSIDFEDKEGLMAIEESGDEAILRAVRVPDTFECPEVAGEVKHLDYTYYKNVTNASEEASEMSSSDGALRDPRNLLNSVFAVSPSDHEPELQGRDVEDEALDKTREGEKSLLDNEGVDSLIYDSSETGQLVISDLEDEFASCILLNPVNSQVYPATYDGHIVSESSKEEGSCVYGGQNLLVDLDILGDLLKAPSCTESEENLSKEEKKRLEDVHLLKVWERVRPLIPFLGEKKAVVNAFEPATFTVKEVLGIKDGVNFSHLPYLSSSQLQPHIHPRHSTDQGETDLNFELGYFSDLDEGTGD
ncbi:hypothetical protein NL676_030010 [Syzygium grande]|nr:hypothetical protein NL676_030010 [Syzygium grande]